MSTLQLENMIKVGLKPSGLAISQDGTKLYVANSGSGTVSIVNTDLFEVSSNVEIQGMPEEVIASSDNRSFYVFNKATGIISKWDSLSSDSKQFLFMIKNPYSMAITPDESKILVVSRTQNSLIIYNNIEKKYDSAVEVGAKPVSVVCAADGKTIYTLDAGDKRISIIDASTYKVVNTIELDPNSFPSSMTLIPNQNKVLVTDAGSENIIIVDVVEAKVVTTIPIGIKSKSVVIAPAYNGATNQVLNTFK
jgi:YVTN family beta-propeller protein